MFISYGVHIDAPPKKIWDVLVIALTPGRIFRGNTQQEVEGLKKHIEEVRT